MEGSIFISTSLLLDLMKKTMEMRFRNVMRQRYNNVLYAKAEEKSWVVAKPQTVAEKMVVVTGGRG